MTQPVTFKVSVSGPLFTGRGITLDEATEEFKRNVCSLAAHYVPNFNNPDAHIKMSKLQLVKMVKEASKQISLREGINAEMTLMDAKHFVEKYLDTL